MSARRWSAVAVAVALAGCADTGDGPAAPPERPSATGEAGTTPTTTGTTADATDTTDTTGPAPGPSSSAAPPTGSDRASGPDAWLGSGLSLETIAEVPEAVALSPRPGTGDLYVAERSGRVWQLERPAGPDARHWRRRPQPVLDLSDETTTDGERGLLGLAFSADGDTLFASYTDRSGNSVLEAFTMELGSAAIDSRRVLLRVDQPYANHNGGHVTRGPDDLLYWGLGDGGSSGDPHGNGQDAGSLLGTVLRIDPAAGGGAPYRVPADNPFVDGGGAPEVWLYGVRNPWRFAFDPATGDLWLADVGQNRWEEINRLTADADRAGAGANLGWSEMEGLEPYRDGTEPEGHHRPVHTYGRTEGRCSVTGGYVYRGSRLAVLDGVYLYGDLCSGEIRGIEVRDGEVAEGPLGVRAEPGTLASFGQDADGEVYVLELAGRVSRLVLPGRGSSVA